jgi:plasmid stabilization system protein ParE
LIDADNVPKRLPYSHTMLPIKVTPVAEAHIQKAAKWWLANREKAAEAFKEELQRGFALISQQQESGAKATNSNLKTSGIPLSRIRYFLYYRVNESRVEVLAMWHSSRLKGPVLKEPPNKPLQPTAEERGG